MKCVRAFAVVAALAGCSPGASDATADARKVTSSLAAILGTCGEAQCTVAQALQTTDMAVAASSLSAAKVACTSAAQTLRTSPLPGVKSAELAGSIDQMADGLGLIEKGVHDIDRSPDLAKDEAQRGSRIYTAGIAAMKAALPTGAG